MLTEFKRLRTVSRGSSSSGSIQKGGFLETALLLSVTKKHSAARSRQLSATIALQFFVRSVGYLHMANSKGLMRATNNSHVMTVLEDRQNGETSLKLT
jgi:hypothetical protein